MNDDLTLYEEDCLTIKAADLEQTIRFSDVASEPYATVYSDGTCILDIPRLQAQAERALADLPMDPPIELASAMAIMMSTAYTAGLNNGRKEGARD